MMIKNLMSSAQNYPRVLFWDEIIWRKVHFGKVNLQNRKTFELFGFEGLNADEPI